MDFKRSRWPWDVHEPKVKHQGYLLKSGRFFGERSAKKRHVALVVDLGGAYLLIGGDGDEEIGSLSQMQDAVGKRKCIDLLVGCAIEERGDDRLGFAVRSPGRTYVFAAMGMEQKLRWVTRLKNAVATGIEQSARPDVLEDAHKNLEQQRGKNNGHHRATAGLARWQESAGVTDDYVELVESPKPKPREGGDDDKAAAALTLQLRERERRLRSEEAGGTIEESDDDDDDDNEEDHRHYRRRLQPGGAGAAAAAVPSTSEHDQHHQTPTKSSWRDTMREYTDAMKSSPNASREFDKEMDSDADGELEEYPLPRGPASVNWTSPQQPTRAAAAALHPDAVRGFSPVGSVSSAGVDSTSKSGATRAHPGGGVSSSSWGGSWYAVGQRLSSPGGGGGGGKRLDYGGDSLRHRTAAKAAEDEAQRSRRLRMVVDRGLAPGEIIQDDDSDDNDDYQADLPALPGGTRFASSSFTPVAFGD